jgi:TonB-dependent starch-binding outer membrane protein SusC
MKIKILLFILMLILPFATSPGQKSNKKVIITGIVIDANQKPVSGAIIFIDNQKTEIQTDNEGIYKIKVKPTASTISAFSVMNGLSEKKIDGKTIINFILKDMPSPGNQAVQNDGDEDLVNVGYGTVKKRNLTTQVGKIDATKSRFAAYKTIFDMIRGELPGVQVNGSNVIIQGPTSINMSNQPLFVVDGVVVNSISEISPGMVKSIEVLKGSSAAIYGARGAAGAILINLLGAK